MEFGPKIGAEMAAEPPDCRAMSNSAAPAEAQAAPLLPSVTLRAACRAPELAGASSAVHSTGRQTKVQSRPSIEECLPHDALEAILGFLDRATLCSARLVSKNFCAAASAHIHTLTFQIASQPVTCQRFPRLGRVTVCQSREGEKLAQVDPRLRDLITTLTIRAHTPEDCQVFIRETLPQLALMPKLRELDVELRAEDLELDVGAAAGFLCQCPNLEIVRLSAPVCNLSRAATIVSMTSLKELSFARALPIFTWVGPGRDWDRPAFSWLQPATALQNLRALSIFAPSEALPLIGNLTGLTGLSWLLHNPGLWRTSEEEEPYSIAPLTRLTKLRSVRIDYVMSESNVDLACSLGLGSLSNLDLSSSDDCGRFLTRQTALTRLNVGRKLCDLRQIGALRLEALQFLKLGCLTSVDAQGFAALRKATSLIGLHIDIATRGQGLQLPSLCLSQGLAELTQLRSLELRPRSVGLGARFLDYPLALPPLTGLTQLVIFEGCLDDGDMRALLVLTGLRELTLCEVKLTDDIVLELGALTNLKGLNLTRCGVTSLEPVTNIVNPLRNARGWPPMEAQHTSDCIIC